MSDVLRTVVLPRLGRVRPAGPGAYRARCPIHEQSSLSVTAGPGRTVLLTCTTLGCRPTSIAAALGLPFDLLSGVGENPGLYRLDDVLTGPGLVYVCDEVRHCRRLWADTDLPATCTRDGRWTAEHAEALAGLDVIVVGETGDDGRAWALQVGQLLAPVAASVDVAQPAHGWDLSDHLDAGGTLDGLTLISRIKAPAWLR